MSSPIKAPIFAPGPAKPAPPNPMQYSIAPGPGGKPLTAAQLRILAAERMTPLLMAANAAAKAKAEARIQAAAAGPGIANIAAAMGGKPAGPGIASIAATMGPKPPGTYGGGRRKLRKTRKSKKIRKASKATRKSRIY